ncbi:MAG: DNA polymerase III subunit beta [Spirochaetes bacterium]|nr:MAG: DNA polymerase III subunit beta [Spirochaetota bacterium]
MSITLDKETLQKYISIADSVISMKNVNTILSNCLFKVSANEIQISATDNELGIRTKLDAISADDIIFTANGKRFASILKELPKGEISVEVSSNYMISLNPKSKDIKANYTLVGSSRDDFPEIPFFFEDTAVEISQGVLKDMLRKVTHASALDTIKPVFNGVYLLSGSDGKLTAVATDSRRLAMISRSVDNEMSISDGVIIPLKTVNEVLRLLSPGGTCMFSVLDNQCFFKIGETELVSRIVEGQFPNFKQVVPKQQSISVSVETRKLVDAVRRAMVFTREPANKIVMHFTSRDLVIEAKTPDLGESTEELIIESNITDKLSIGINAQFLMDTLKEIDSHAVSIGLTGQMSPVTICPEDDPDFLSVIMPIQIKTA